MNQLRQSRLLRHLPCMDPAAFELWEILKSRKIIILNFFSTRQRKRRKIALEAACTSFSFCSPDEAMTPGTNLSSFEDCASWNCIEIVKASAFAEIILTLFFIVNSDESTLTAKATCRSQHDNEIESEAFKTSRDVSHCWMFRLHR